MTRFLFTFLGCASALWLIARAHETRGGFLLKLIRRFRARHVLEILFFVIFGAKLCIHGGSKTNAPAGSPQQPETQQSSIINHQSLSPFDYSLLTSSTNQLTPGQYAAGFALVSVSTNAAPWPSAPSNAVVHPPWTVYGVAEDTFWLPATDWSFILGTNTADGLHVSSSGLVSFGNPLSTPDPASVPENASLLAPLQGSLGTVPPGSRFWHAPTASNSLLLTWENLFAGRDTNAPVSFQAELHGTGDFTFRYSLPENSALLDPASSFTNLLIGALHNNGGQVFALNDPSAIADGLELRWRAFGLLDPENGDHDGDGLSDYDEVMLHGTDPAMPDTDLDGLSDHDELFIHNTCPLNCDSDGDGIADGLDPAPLVWDDAAADTDGDGMGLLEELLHGLDPLTADAATDSDGDGWADWKELLAGSDPADPSDTPQNPDGSCRVFDATFTLNAGLPFPVALGVGSRALVLRQAGSVTLTLAEGTAYPVTLAAPAACAADITVTIGSPHAAFQPGGPAGRNACGLIAQPSPAILPARVCFHADGPKSVALSVTPPMPGTCAWDWPAGFISASGGLAARILWPEYSPGGVTATFTAEGASQGRSVWREVTRCSRAASEPQDWCETHDCEHWLCACDHKGVSPDTWCHLHGCPVSGCPPSACPACGLPYPECVCEEPDDPYPPEPRCPVCGQLPMRDAEGYLTCGCGPEQGTARKNGEPAFGGWHGLAAAPNVDDDDADGQPDSGSAPVPGENDLVRIWPLGSSDGQCCPCPGHAPVYGADQATLAYRSPRLALWSDACKSNAPGSSVSAGEPVWVEGLSASAEPAGDLLVWELEGGAGHVTNAFTVFGVRLWGDIGLDGQVGADDRALHAGLDDRTGWAVPAAPGVFRPVRLRTDVGFSGGAYSLELSGTPGAFRIWPDATGTNAPLLECGQTVTNGAGTTFLAGTETDLYFEAVSNGTATLTYRYAGTGEAAGLICSAALKMTGWSVTISADTDRNGIIEDTDLEGKSMWTLERGAIVHPYSVSLYETQTTPYTNCSRIALNQTDVPHGFTFRLKAADNETSDFMFFVDMSGEGGCFSPQGFLDIPNCPTNLYVTSCDTRKVLDDKPACFTLDLEALYMGQVVNAERLLLAVAPVILPPECNPAEAVYATSAELALAIPGTQLIPTGQSQWTQDQVKFTKTQHAEGRVNDLAVILGHPQAGDIHTILARTNGIPWCHWPVSGQGGNMMATPPLPDAPYGKIMLGTKNLQSLPRWVAQGIQPVVAISNDWLAVGHVDEILMWSAADKVLFADPWKAADLLHGEIAAGRGSSTIWWGTDFNAQRDTEIQCIVVDGDKIGMIASSLPDSALTTNLVFNSPLFEVGDILRVDDEILELLSVSADGLTGTVARAHAGRPASAHTNGSVIYAYSAVMQKNLPIGLTPDNSIANRINLALNQVLQSIGSYQADAVSIPVLFEIGHIDENGRALFVAQTANMVNCLVVNSQSAYYSDPGNALFRSYFESIVPGAHPLDVWYDYHCNQGGVHCGTAARRTLSTQSPWWEQDVDLEQWEDMP